MTEQPDAAPRKARALFDLRFVLATLFIIYGVIVTINGLAFTSPAELAKAGGWNVNLWSGVAMIIVAALFAGWAWWRPVRVPVEPEPSSPPTQPDVP